MPRKKPFNGTDWTELAERWDCIQLDTEGDDDEDATLSACRSYMLSSIGDQKQLAIVANDIREYLEVFANVAKRYHYEWPVWKGMLKIKKSRADEDDRHANEVLVKLTVELLPSMWS